MRNLVEIKFVTLFLSLTGVMYSPAIKIQDSYLEFYSEFRAGGHATSSVRRNARCLFLCRGFWNLQNSNECEGITDLMPFHTTAFTATLPARNT
jgi:hypothetical protein